MRWTRWVALVLLVGCGSNEPSTSSETNETEVDETGSEEPSAAADGTVDGRWFVPAGSPPPQACEAPEDCMGDTIPDAAQPCCNDPYSLSAYAIAYRDAINAWRQSHCADVTCPPPPAPTPPPDCAFEMRCVEGQCANACE